MYYYEIVALHRNAAYQMFLLEASARRKFGLLCIRGNT
jgi:hypothetical protein